MIIYIDVDILFLFFLESRKSIPREPKKRIEKKNKEEEEEKNKDDDEEDDEEEDLLCS